VSFTLPAPTTSPGPPSSYPRQAWLQLGDDRLYLDDFDTGYACMELNIGYPEVRAVVDNNPDRDGVNDRTSLVGARVVTATIQAWPGGTITIDDIARLFGPYTYPGVRPELHWTLNTADHAERMLTLRAADFSSPMPAPITREIQLGWVAPDPVCYDPNAQSATAWSGTGGTYPGRTYNLTFPRVYPPGTGGAPIPATIVVVGDVAVLPTIVIWGPVTGPVVTLTKQLARNDTVQQTITFAFNTTVNIPAGGQITINAANRTVTDNSGNSLIAQVDWTGSTWPALAPGDTWVMTLTGGTTSGVTQAVATWREGYLTP